MKKLVLTIALVLGFATLSFADPDGGGMFGRNKAANNNNTRTEGGLLLPDVHGSNQDWNGEEEPLGSGIAVLMGLGAAYLVGKKRKEE